MKRFIVLAAGSLALVAGNAFAEGCAYGKHQAAMASADDAVQEPVADEALSPELLALLKRQEEQTLEQSLTVPNVHN